MSEGTPITAALGDPTTSGPRVLAGATRRGGLHTGRVGLVPFQDDPVSVYRSLDIAVHASTRPEPFGLTVAEAMSCGRAVVVSAAGGAMAKTRSATRRVLCPRSPASSRDC